MPRYFLFHASLIPCFCLLAEPHAVGAPSWKADIQLTHETLDNAFASNPLAARCSEILKKILPGSSSHSNETWPNVPDGDGLDFHMWTAEGHDPFASLDWPELT